MKLSDDIKLMIPMVISASLALCLAGGSLWYNKQQLDLFVVESLKLKSEFSETHILKEGIIESPSVIILLENKTDFLSKLKELNATIIYYEETFNKISFYVFGYEGNMLVAYRFTNSAL